MEDFSETLDTNAAKPRRASGDAGSVEQHSLKEQMDFDRYDASNQAMAKPKRGFAIQQFKPPGSNGGPG